MVTEYKRNLNNNYLILQLQEAEIEHTYQMKMIQQNNITGLLKCSMQKIDGDIKLLYEISSKQTLYVLLENKELDSELLNAILIGFIKVMEGISEYLLDPDYLMTDPNYIYMNLESKRLYFCYSPTCQKGISKAFHEFTEYLLTKIDHTDKKAVVLGYEVYKQTMDLNFNLADVMESVFVKSNNMEDASLKKQEIPQDLDEQSEDLLQQPSEPLFYNKKLIYEHVPKHKEYSDKTVLEIGILLVVLYAIVGIKWGLFHLPFYLFMITPLSGAILIVYFLVRHLNKKMQKSGKDEVHADYVNEEDMTDINLESTDKRKRDFTEESNVKREVQQGSYGDTTILAQIPMSNTKKLVKIDLNSELCHEIVIDKSPFCIGKLDSMVDAVIEAPQISRIHAKIVNDGDQYYIIDLNSTNGTYLNDIQVIGNDRIVCKDGDILYFADIGYEFR